MAALIRLAGETDAEFQRRCRPLFEALSTGLYKREIYKILANDNAITNHLKIAELRRSCGAEPTGDTFTWDISAAPKK